MMRVPLLMSATAKTPRPCTGELRTSISAEVTMGGPPFVGCVWSNVAFGPFVFTLLMDSGSYGNGRLDRGMVLIVHDLEIFEVVLEKARRPAQQVQPGQR